MGDIFHEKADRDLFFSTFANDLGSQLDQLRFEYEAIENGTIAEEPEKITDDITDGRTLESKVQSELEKNLANGGITEQKEPKERQRTYTQTIQRAFSTVSLMTNFKSNFWKHRRGKNTKKSEDNEQRVRRASTSSTPEKNNNREVPQIELNGQSEGRSTLYSTAPRPGKKIQRSKTMSPSKPRPIENIPSELETLERTESGNVYIPPVVVDGQLVYDFQYATPREGSPIQKSAKLSRRNSISRFLRMRKSPRKSPKKAKNTTPIKNLYEKTVLTASNSEINKAGRNTEATKSSDDTIKVEVNGNVTKVEINHDSTKAKPNGDVTKAEVNSDVTKPNGDVTKAEVNSDVTKPNGGVTEAEVNSDVTKSNGDVRKPANKEKSVIKEKANPASDATIKSDVIKGEAKHNDDIIKATSRADSNGKTHHDALKSSGQITSA